MRCEERNAPLNGFVNGGVPGLLRCLMYRNNASAEQTTRQLTPTATPTRRPVLRRNWLRDDNRVVVGDEEVGLGVTESGEPTLLTEVVVDVNVGRLEDDSDAGPCGDETEVVGLAIGDSNPGSEDGTTPRPLEAVKEEARPDPPVELDVAFGADVVGSLRHSSLRPDCTVNVSDREDVELSASCTIACSDVPAGKSAVHK